MFLCLHGAAHSALSFACLARRLKSDFTVVAFDFRGHGEHRHENEADLSVDTLITDTCAVFDSLVEKFPERSFIIVGHSMGGSIATKTVKRLLERDGAESETYKRIQSLVVIDVVEGSAMDALPFMEDIVRKRPTSFKSIADAVKYGVTSQTVRHLESARVSMPAQVVQEGERWVWRTDLLASQTHWESWFRGLTKDFLEIRYPKVLLLAGADRMDKELTIAHMQGRFSMKVVNDVGHVVHEDDPAATEEIIRKHVDTFQWPENYKV